MGSEGTSFCLRGDPKPSQNGLRAQEQVAVAMWLLNSSTAILASDRCLRLPWKMSKKTCKRVNSCGYSHMVQLY